MRHPYGDDADKNWYRHLILNNEDGSTNIGKLFGIIKDKHSKNGTMLYLRIYLAYFSRKVYLKLATSNQPYVNNVKAS